MGVTAGIFLASILLKEMRYLVYIRYLWYFHAAAGGILAKSITMVYRYLGIPFSGKGPSTIYVNLQRHSVN